MPLCGAWIDESRRVTHESRHTNPHSSQSLTILTILSHSLKHKSHRRTFNLTLAQLPKKDHSFNVPACLPRHKRPEGSCTVHEASAINCTLSSRPLPSTLPSTPLCTRPLLQHSAIALCYNTIDCTVHQASAILVSCREPTQSPGLELAAARVLPLFSNPQHHWLPASDKGESRPLNRP